MKKILFILLIVGGCASQNKIYPPQINKAPHGWTVAQFQTVIDCTFEDGNGSDWSCDSCYLVKAAKYHIPVDTAILNYY
jgi:hypothetical protein